MEKNIEFPDCWEELQPSEWLHLLESRELLMTKPGISLLDVKREWCAFVLKTRGLIPSSNKTEFYLLVDELAQTLDWMWQTVEDTRDDGTTVMDVALTYESTVNLLPEWGGLRGPVSHGADLTFGEFRHAVEAMNRYDGSHAPADLQALCGILYRRPGKQPWLGREPFDGKKIAYYMEQVSAMPSAVRWGVYAWFSYFCQYLISGPFLIGGLEVCFAPVFARSKRGTDAQPVDAQSLGMNSILFSVAESGVFGNAKETDRTPLLSVMMKLLDDKQRADELTRHLKHNS